MVFQMIRNRQTKRFARELVKRADISKVDKVADLELDVIRKIADEQGESWHEVEALLQRELNKRFSRHALHVIGALMFLIVSIVLAVGLLVKSCSMFFDVIGG